MLSKRHVSALLTITLTSVAGLTVFAAFYHAAPPGLLRVGEGILGNPTEVVLPTNQTITPVGNVVQINNNRPKDLAVSPDGKRIAALCQGNLIVYSEAGVPLGSVAISAGPLGIAWSPDSNKIYVALTRGEVGVLNISRLTSGLEKTWVVDTPVNDLEIPDVAAGRAGRGAGLKDPQVAGLAVSNDGSKLYVALGIRNALAVIDTATGQVTKTLSVDAAPYHITLSPDGTRLAVSCRGGEIARLSQPHALSAKTRIRIDSDTDAALDGSILLVDTGKMKVSRKITGVRQPGKVAFINHGLQLAIPGTDDDTLWIASVSSVKPLRGIPMAPSEDAEFGHIPTAVIELPDQRLAVACGGVNAIAIVDQTTLAVTGFIPTGWYPIALGHASNALFVANSKGTGGRVKQRNGAFNVHGTIGTLQVIPDSLSTNQALIGHTRRVAINNRWESKVSVDRLPRLVNPQPIPDRVGEPSVFDHVVYIIKENQTYDSLLGDMPGGNGDPKLCLFPEDVSPNHHALAREFVLLDNTYASGTNSADGHQWAVSAMGNGYIEQNYAAHSRSYPYDGGDPLAYSPRGFLWNAAIKAGKSLRVYGEFVNKPSIVNTLTGKVGGFAEIWKDYKKGFKNYTITSGTDNATLRPYLHPNYIGFPNSVPDQWRADLFIKDLERFEAIGTMPNLSILLLPNDHTSGTSDVSPTPRATVADNDLALGRIVERLSHSPFWAKTLILVIEDDAQLGLDHVDGHRTTALCISAYTKRHTTVSQQYNHPSFLRTIELVLGLKPMNRFDATATPLTACFNKKPDMRPYKVRMNKIPLDEMNSKVATLKGDAKTLAIACGKMNWNQVDSVNASVVSKAIWQLIKPTIPFPIKSKNSLFAAEYDGD